MKATVDAYDGSVDLYVWDESDPVIKAWEKIFPGQYHQLSDISGDLMSHMRYPESLFKVQRELLSKYHVTSASQYYSGEDFWQTPVDPTESQSQQDQDILQPPYYLTLQTGGTEEPVFSLTSTYIPAGQSTREILTGFLSVDSDAGNEKGKIGSNYGTIRLRSCPRFERTGAPARRRTTSTPTPMYPRTEPAAIRRHASGARQPAHPAARWRTAVRAARVRQVFGRDLIPVAQEDAGRIR